MTENGTLAGRTILMSGGSRGIGLAIALRAARDGANVALIAKTDEPDPRLRVLRAPDAAVDGADPHRYLVGGVGHDRLDRAGDRVVGQVGGPRIVDVHALRHEDWGAEGR